MEDQDKLKEDLLRELQELRQELNSLKTSYKRDIADRQLTEESLHYANWQMASLVEAARTGTLPPVP